MNPAWTRRSMSHAPYENPARERGKKVDVRRRCVSGNLHFAYLKLSDASEPGVYKVASTNNLVGSVLSSAVVLKVTDRGKFHQPILCNEGAVTPVFN